MKNVWKFLNGPLISAVAAGAIIWGLDYSKEDESRQSEAAFLSQINELSKSYFELAEYAKNTRELLHFHQPEIDIPEPDIITEQWNTVLDVSWVKKGYKTDVYKFASYDNNKLKFFVNLDDIDEQSASIRITGQGNYKKSGTLDKNAAFPFEFNGQKLRIKLIDIRSAGYFRGLAMYYTIEKSTQ
ncbi:MAG: hypothetical protein HRT53_16520 [Colwellia sp.]|nr:hypothetical protein [Colwellia sp.]